MKITYPPHIYAAEKVEADLHARQDHLWRFCFHPVDRQADRRIRVKVASDLRLYLETGEVFKSEYLKVGKSFCAELLAALDDQIDKDQQDEVKESRNHRMLRFFLGALAVAVLLQIIKSL